MVEFHVGAMLTMSCFTSLPISPASVWNAAARLSARQRMMSLLARNVFLPVAILKKLSCPVAVLLLIAATFVVYAPALRNGFVWDDTALVLRDPLIRSWRLIPESFGHFLFLDATASNFYRPLQRLTFTADYALYGFDAPWGWHLTSILTHAAAAVALFFLARRLLARDGLAFAAALVWAVHPVFTSAVTYVSGRADSLAALFGFAGLALGLRSLQATGRAALATVGAAVCFLAALLSKESGVAALLVWFLILAAQRVSLRVWGKWLGLSVVVLGTYLGLRFSAERTPPPAPPATSLAVRPVLAARAVAEYAGLLLAPVTLRMERDVSITVQTSDEVARLRHWQTALGAAIVGAFGVWWWRARRRQPEVALCLVACGIAYLPISNLFSLNATVAEHWLYVPAAFLAIAASAALADWLSKCGGKMRAASLAFFSGWLALMCCRTAMQHYAWKDQRAFVETTIRGGGDSARMEINLGNVELAAGDYRSARLAYGAALERAPSQPLAWFGLANVAMRTGDFAAAREALGKVAKSPLLKAEVLQARSVLVNRELGLDGSDLLAQALEVAPRSWAVRKRYVEYLTERGRARDAVRELSDLLTREPFRGESWRMLGGLLERLGDPVSARCAYEEAMRRDVRDTISPARAAALSSAPSIASR